MDAAVLAAACLPLQLHCIVQRGIHHLLVSLPDLGVAQRRLAARAVCDNGIVLPYDAGLLCAFQYLPLALYELVIKGAVRLVVIKRDAKLPVCLLPLRGVLCDYLFALRHYALYSKPLDCLCLAAGHTELLFCLQLDWQPLRVPSGVELYVRAAQRAEPVPQVLDYPAPQVPHVRRAVHGGGTLYEPGLFSVFGGLEQIRRDVSLGQISPHAQFYALGIEFLR